MTPDAGQILPIAGNLHWIPAPNHSRFPHCNGFLLDGPETVLIDTGLGAETIREIDRKKRIDVLLITHSHPDHILAWHVLADRHILLPEETPDAVFNLLTLGTRFTGNPEDGKIWETLVRDFLGIQPMREPDRRFGDGSVIELGGCELEAFHAPGHIDDHYCFLERTTGTLLTTDIDFTSFGPWYGNAESDPERFAQSVRRIMQVPHERACSSHKPPVTENTDAHFQAFLEAFDRQKFEILDLLVDGPLDFQAMLERSPYYNNRLYDRRLQHIFEGHMIRSNLRILMRDSLVVSDNGHFRRA